MIEDKETDTVDLETMNKNIHLSSLNESWAQTDQKETKEKEVQAVRIQRSSETQTEVHRAPTNEELSPIESQGNFESQASIHQLIPESDTVVSSFTEVNEANGSKDLSESGEERIHLREKIRLTQKELLDQERKVSKMMKMTKRSSIENSTNQ